MAARGMMVNNTVTITYDGVSQRITRGTVIDVPSGSSLNTLLGANITALTAQQQAGSPGVDAPAQASAAANLSGDPVNTGQEG